MGILQTLAGTAKCPKCKGRGDPTEWLSGPGLDMSMMQFKCRSCGTLFYLLVRENEQLLLVKERQAALAHEKEAA